MRVEEWNNKVFFELLEQELKERKWVRFRVKGVSMQPMIRNERDEVGLHACKMDEPKVGDICLFKFKGRHILHRLVDVKDGMLYMRGDNVFGSREWCTREEVLGIVDRVYRDGKEWKPKAWTWRVKIGGYRWRKYGYIWAGRIYRGMKRRIGMGVRKLGWGKGGS